MPHQMLLCWTTAKLIYSFEATYLVLQGKADSHNLQCDSAAMSRERGPWSRALATVGLTLEKICMENLVNTQVSKENYNQWSTKKTSNHCHSHPHSPFHTCKRPQSWTGNWRKPHLPVHCGSKRGENRLASITWLWCMLLIETLKVPCAMFWSGRYVWLPTESETANWTSLWNKTPHRLCWVFFLLLNYVVTFVLVALLAGSSMKKWMYKLSYSNPWAETITIHNEEYLAICNKYNKKSSSAVMRAAHQSLHSWGNAEHQQEAAGKTVFITHSRYSRTYYKYIVLQSITAIHNFLLLIFKAS